MNLLYLAIALVAPIILLLNGRKFLGSQTHPAAIFLLAWILCSAMLSMMGNPAIRPGLISFVWVSICFPITSFIKGRRKGHQQAGGEKDDSKD